MEERDGLGGGGGGKPTITPGGTEEGGKGSARGRSGRGDLGDGG